MGAVGDGAIGEQGGVDGVYALYHGIEPLDVEQSVLLAGEGSLGKILGRRGGSNGHGHLRAIAESRVGSFDLRSQLDRKRSILNPATNLGAGAPERADIVQVQTVEGSVDTLTEPVLGQEVAVGQRGDRETAGHIDPFPGERADHLPK